MGRHSGKRGGIPYGTKVKPIFLHICCGNCACFPKKFLEGLEGEEFEVTGFWYNPNIHPYQEYQKRLMTTGYFALRTNLRMVWDINYNLEAFITNLHRIFARPQRCKYCYTLRLNKTAEVAKRNGFKIFSTTLLYSIHQDHYLIREIGKKIAKKYGLKFYDCDYRKGWKEGIEISKELGLYRQNYCGCIFSEKERYLNKK